MKFGLTKEEYDFLIENLVLPLKTRGARVYIFGSRATGRHRAFSDIDVLYSAPPESPLKNADVYKILASLEESTFPYKIDLVNEADLATSYRDAILKSRIEL
jgi:predicted nucleotidyltransferase